MAIARVFEGKGLRPKFVDSELTGDQRFDLVHGTEDVHFDSWVTIFLNIQDGADWVLLGEAYQTGVNTTALAIQRFLKSIHGGDFRFVLRLVLIAFLNRDGAVTYQVGITLCRNARKVKLGTTLLKIRSRLVDRSVGLLKSSSCLTDLFV